KDTPVRLVSRAYRSPSSRLAYARFATLRGGALDVGNALCLPRPRRPGEDAPWAVAPIFGVDLVAFGRDTALVVADLSPTCEGSRGRAAQLEAMARWRDTSEVGTLPPAGPLPAWAACCLSPHALSARVGAAELTKIRVALARLGDTFVRLVQDGGLEPEPHRGAGPVSAGDAPGARMIDQYLCAHRMDETSLGLLSHVFGKDWATAYRDQVLFPTLKELA
ncbi:MAG TPA: hypothetical protein VH877_08455, partial [Polyangia bacterium]|nr:hypothetical protein [Polyangia bacterium]